jgi:thiol peroxidase
MQERIGEAFEAGEQLTVVGARLRVGDSAPDFTLDWIDGTTGAITPVGLADTAGAVRLLNVINSIDTPVCQIETRTWDGRIPAESEVSVLTVSMDLPFALDRWRETESSGHKLLSSHRSDQFGQDYGVLLKEWRLLQRAVFVVDAQGLIAHVEYVPDQMKEPDYDAAIAAITS